MGTDLVAVMCWMSGAGTDGQPVLGAQERAKLPADAIQDLDGLELAFNVPHEIVANFEGQLIDFIEGPNFNL